MWLAIPVSGRRPRRSPLVVGSPCLRVRGPYFVILTLGVAEFIKYIVVSIEAGLANWPPGDWHAEPTRSSVSSACGARGPDLIGSSSPLGRFGIGLLAIREDEIAAEAVGGRAKA